ncbi:MAG: FAD-dependent oxidoreductase [Kiritimatiellae bacterium]|nr:FAD-dependent oxidoreductase [Kiritimatiellia bacterium]
MNDEHVFTLQEAVQEAKRCLNCAQPVCRTGCPIENDIPGFIQAVVDGNIGQAGEILAQRTNLPAICGRICPHELQCESHCILARKNAAIRIGKIELFIADMIAEMGFGPARKVLPPKKGNVAVIGSGPAGLTIAGDLAKLGFALTVFDSQPEPGGVLMYGIPAFRLPKHVVHREIDKLRKLGVEFKVNVMIGPDITVDTLFAKGFDAICIATGNALPQTLNVPGEELPGIVPAIYFLQMVILAETSRIDPGVVPVRFGDRVVVVGGGNVAVDVARAAKRRGAASVCVVARNPIEQCSFLPSEIAAAKTEGVVFRDGLAVDSFCGADRVEKVSLNQGSVQLTVDIVLIAIGQRPAARIVSTTTGINVDSAGRVIIRELPFGITSRSGVFATGEVVHGPATVVLAMREAKKVAAGIASYVEAKTLMTLCESQEGEGSLESRGIHD